MASVDPKTLIEIYRRKVLNQELSLKEFAEKKVFRTSKPSKILFELLRTKDSFRMSKEILFKACDELLPDAYFCDVRGLDSILFKDDWESIFTKLKDFPLINWHMMSTLSVPQPAFWDLAVSCGFMTGFSYDKINDTVLMNLDAISTALKSHQRGFLYFVVVVHKGNVAELPYVMELAAKYGVHEVQLKTFVFENNETIPLKESDKPLLKQMLDACVASSIANKIRLTLNDQGFGDLVDPELLRRAATVPYPHPNLNFPLKQELDKEFWRERPWWPLDSKVLDRSKVSIYRKCYKPFHFVHVNPEGGIGPCNHLIEPPYFLMGSLASQSFDEIWNSQPFQDFRKILIKQPLQDHRCEWCFQNRLED